MFSDESKGTSREILPALAGSVCTEGKDQWVRISKENQVFPRLFLRRVSKCPEDLGLRVFGGAGFRGGVGLSQLGCPEGVKVAIQFCHGQVLAARASVGFVFLAAIWLSALLFSVVCFVRHNLEHRSQKNVSSGAGAFVGLTKV